MERSGAQLLIDCLCRQGVDTIFGYPGGAIMPVYDALHARADRLRHVLVRHEQAAVHAAEGYARASGRVGACVATSGPGATNLITGLADALADSTPLVAVTGQVPSAKLGTDAFQESDVMGLTLAATKWSHQIVDADTIPEVVARAFEIAAAGRPGPVLLDVTRDAQTQMVRDAPAAPHESWSYPRLGEDLRRLEEAAALVNAAERPYLIVGQGAAISGAEAAVRALAERADIPVASTLLGLSVLPSDHPLMVGMVGMHGNYGANLLTNEADVIVAVGMRFDDRVTGRVCDYARQAKIIHVEIDPAEVDRQVPAEVALIGDARRTLEALLPLVEPRQRPGWHARFATCWHAEHQEVIGPQLSPAGEALSMGEVVERLHERTRGEAIVVSDVGQHQMMAARHYGFRRHRSHITSGGLGTMGFGLPAAMGAKLAAPDRTVVAVLGDGGFQMTLQELATLVRERVAVKIVVLNNHYLGMVRQWQELFFDGRYSEVELDNPDFVTICRGFGVPAERVTRRDDLEGAIDWMLAADGPHLLDVHVAREANVFPMIEMGASVEEIRLS